MSRELHGVSGPNVGREGVATLARDEAIAAVHGEVIGASASRDFRGGRVPVDVVALDRVILVERTAPIAAGVLRGVPSAVSEPRERAGEGPADARETSGRAHGVRRETNVLHDVCQVRRPAKRNRVQPLLVIRRDENALFHALHVEHGHVLVRRREKSANLLVGRGVQRRDVREPKQLVERGHHGQRRVRRRSRPRLKLAHLGTKRIRRRGETFRDLRAKFLEVWRETKFPGEIRVGSGRRRRRRRRRRAIRVVRRRRRIRIRRRLRVAGFYRRLAAGADHDARGDTANGVITVGEDAARETSRADVGRRRGE